MLRAGYAKVYFRTSTLFQYSWTALICATRNNYVDIVNLLLQYKPNVNVVDNEGCTALTIACKEGYQEIAVALVLHGAYINQLVSETNIPYLGFVGQEIQLQLTYRG